MIRNERVVEHLNHALGALMADDPRVLLLGEDIADPYGGAFKVTRGLSALYPDRVLCTPISEGAIVGLAAGMALCGDRPVVEIMFGDFVALAFDQILNFATKSVTMYGRDLGLGMLIRCPVGGNRGYGPTHSQSLQKHFIGIPNLSLFELSQFHDMTSLLRRAMALGHPSILFEDKVLYGERIYRGGAIDDLFRFEFLDDDGLNVRIFSDSFDGPRCLIITAGGMVPRAIAAARELFIEEEICAEIIVPARLYPFDYEPLLEHARCADQLFIVEESTPGGTWGSEVAAGLYQRLWGSLANRIVHITSRDSIIPAAPHLERAVLVQRETIVQEIARSCRRPVAGATGSVADAHYAGYDRYH